MEEIIEGIRWKEGGEELRREGRAPEDGRNRRR